MSMLSKWIDRQIRKKGIVSVTFWFLERIAKATKDQKDDIFIAKIKKAIKDYK
tara:strand:+ start:823 stop:981 length:159 start_codon:yes stop_codon:yes gene_type:complete